MSDNVRVEQYLFRRDLVTVLSAVSTMVRDGIESFERRPSK